MTFTELAVSHPDHIMIVMDALMSVEEAAAELNKSVAWVRAKAAGRDRQRVEKWTVNNLTNI